MLWVGRLSLGVGWALLCGAVVECCGGWCGVRGCVWRVVWLFVVNVVVGHVCCSRVWLVYFFFLMVRAVAPRCCGCGVGKGFAAVVPLYLCWF